MKLTNSDLIYFCQNLLGAPYWFNASAIKATKNAYKVNSLRFPEEYNKRNTEFYERAIAEHEVVTDSIGMIKGFMWSDGGKDILENRGNHIIHTYKIGINGCPDKTVNGMFSWATTQDIKWGSIDTLPEIPGLVVTTHGRLAIYEGNGYVIEANKEAGIVTREPISNNIWRFWYELPFITYSEEVKVIKKIDPAKFVLELNGLGVAVRNALFREGQSEDTKFLDVIKQGEKVEVYNDSTEKQLHIVYKGKEGYTTADLFIYYPEKPNIISDNIPQKVHKKLQGPYRLLRNTGIRNKAQIRSNAYTVLPKDIEVICTGGQSGDWLHVYAKYNNKSYVGYIESKNLKKVIYVEK